MASQNKKKDEALEEKIRSVLLEIVTARGVTKTCCPSEVRHV